jgi:AcrR family transcriptional regulator
MNTKPQIERSDSTEEKIKEAARRVFIRKGYAATRTRDIAEESGYNLSLINYYFRSKEKLFDIIMVEHIQAFIHSVMGIINDPATTLPQKMSTLISHYIDMLIRNPDLPLFILNEVNADPAKLIARVGIDKVSAGDTYIAKQWQEMAEKTKMPAYNPVHILMNMVSLTIFPFIASPIVRNRTGMSQDAFNALMEERKKLIPMWIHSMIGAKP